MVPLITRDIILPDGLTDCYMETRTLTGELVNMETRGLIGSSLITIETRFLTAACHKNGICDKLLDCYRYGASARMLL